jgi:chromosome segregation ATPase
MLDIPLILDKLEEIQQTLGAADTAVNYAKDQAVSAENEAYDARNRADEAEDYARYAKDHAEEAEGHLETIKEAMEEVVDLLKAAQNTDGERSFQADMRKHKKQVVQWLKNGAPIAKIAKDLKLSEFLVQAIQDEIQRDQAA